MAFTFEQYIDGTAKNAHFTLNERRDHSRVLRRVHELFERVLPVLSSNAETPMIFVPIAHADFLAGTRLALGGELPASFAAARTCAEDALYAFFLHRNPALLPIWAARQTSTEARAQVRRAFTYGAMIRSLTTYSDEVGAKVDLAYQIAIDMGAHPNIMKVFANLAEHAEGDPAWQYINLQKADVEIALRVVAMSGLAALSTFELIWPLTFGSTDSSSMLTDVHKLFVSLPNPNFSDGAE